jgi:hypothetical protein
VPERILLFCIASGTEWERAGVTAATVTAMVIRGLMEHGPGGELSLTTGPRRARGTAGRAQVNARLPELLRHRTNLRARYLGDHWEAQSLPAVLAREDGVEPQ